MLVLAIHGDGVHVDGEVHAGGWLARSELYAGVEGMYVSVKQIQFEISKYVNTYLCMYV